MFLGTALSISSIKIVAMVVREMNFMRRNLGQIIVSSAIMEDTVGWIIISVTLGIAGAGGVAVGSMARTIIGTALFLAFSYTAGRWLVFQLIRWVNDTFLSEYAVITAILIVMCAMALVTQAIGVNTVLGAFVAGVLVGESPILSTQIQDELRGFITAFMMPIFFGLSGLSADLTILRDPHLLMLTAGLVAIATFGKFGGAFFGGKIGGLGNSESLALGCAMNARGSTEVIVASIGLSMGALTQNLYSMIVTMAVITTMAMPPMLRWALGRLPTSREEQKRLDTEDIDSKGFVSRIDRVLVAGDESSNARFAIQLGGFIAGQRGKPITALQFGAKQAADRKSELEQVVAGAAKSGHLAPHGDEPPPKADISVRVESGNAAEAVTTEAANGYELLVLGFEGMYGENGAFAATVDKIAQSFRQPIALAIAGQQKGGVLDVKDWKVLVPINGTEASRRGAELAYAFSLPGHSEITVLHVARAPASGRNLSRPRNVAGERSRRAVLRDAVKLGARYGHEKIAAVEHTDEAADTAIVAEAERIGAQLIVIGATRRVGGALFLGETVASILQKWRGAIVIVAADETAPQQGN
jgi:Kef-type K+ transport system membrane component KefB/nucleotide-binding universal stress UspA family protein